MEDQAPPPPGTAVVLESGYIRTMAGGIDSFESAHAIVQAWHELTHSGGFRFCTEQPCHALHYKRR
jgi:hypothetical protein